MDMARASLLLGSGGYLRHQISCFVSEECDTFLSLTLSPFVVKYYGSYFKNTDLWVSLFNPLLPYILTPHLLNSTDRDGVLRCWVSIRHNENYPQTSEF